MNRKLLVVTVAAGVLAAVVGCARGTNVAEPGDRPAEATTAGVRKAPVSTWAATTCTGFVDTLRTIATFIDYDPTAHGSSARAKQAALDLLNAAIKRTSEIKKKLADGGAPDIADGERIQQVLLTDFAGQIGVFETSRRDAEAINPSAPNFTEAVMRALSGEGNPAAQGEPKVLVELENNAEIKQAMDAHASCRDLRGALTGQSAL
ncbi:hypothetical protein [Allokutzneria oryzae]|uniref:Lipoprotein n=1 Tax=Allokutzneria oryzae TaxID=1378989 RepID=A0ABV6A2R1_9PSEU